MPDEYIRPCSLPRRRTTDPQSRIDRLNRAHRVVIEFKVSPLLRISHPEIEVRFVPDFEIPLRNFTRPIPVHEMPRELSDHVFPLGVILGRRNVLLIPKCMKGVLIGDRKSVV